MIVHDKSKSVLNRSQEHFSLVDVNTKLSFKLVNHMNANSQINSSCIIQPICFESYRNSFPSKRVYFSQSLSNGINDSFSY